MREKESKLNQPCSDARANNSWAIKIDYSKSIVWTQKSANFSHAIFVDWQKWLVCIQLYLTLNFMLQSSTKHSLHANWVSLVSWKCGILNCTLIPCQVQSSWANAEAPLFGFKRSSQERKTTATHSTHRIHTRTFDVYDWMGLEFLCGCVVPFLMWTSENHSLNLSFLHTISWLLRERTSLPDAITHCCCYYYFWLLFY